MPFLFATCQAGAERALKDELARACAALRPAYARPGFVTFKLPAEAAELPLDALRPVFARSFGVSLGQAAGEEYYRLAAEVWRLAGERPVDRLHVWQRDAAAPGVHDVQPAVTALALEAQAAILGALAGGRGAPAVGTAQAGEQVLDCILVEPREWWIGAHRAAGPETCWPGGVFAAELPAGAVSRAWLKLEESLAWSQLPLRRGESVVEIGCAPGGSCQALLERGMIVTGVDPAAVDPRVLAHPHFTHLRKRGADVRRRELRGFRWLTADLNVAPRYTLDTVEAIVTHPALCIEGLLLTLKLLDWKLAAELPDWLARVRSWGYRQVRARQLSHNRQEVCLAARRT